MRGRRGVGVLVAAVVVLAVAVVLLVQHQEAATPTAAGRATRGEVSAVLPGEMVHVESGRRSTRFLPLGSAPMDGRTFTAQHAYNMLVSSSPKLNPIPATVTPYYGVLTDASASPTALHVRVWGFAVVSDCRGTGGPSASGAPTSARPTRCRLWEFVDARTGRHVGVISEEVVPD